MSKSRNMNIQGESLTRMAFQTYSDCRGEANISIVSVAMVDVGIVRVCVHHRLVAVGV